MNLMITMKIEIAAIKVLVAELGWAKLMQVVSGMPIRMLKGEPWKGQPKAESKKDKDSRNMIASAVLLYRQLLLYMDQKRAEEIIRKVIIEAAIAQLQCLIPTLKEEDLRKMTPKERTKCYCDIVAKFPNTDWSVTKDTEEEVSISMSRCRFAEIFRDCGHPELCDSCCAGDQIYFERYQPEIAFSREHMLGKGDKECDFNFKLKNN